VFLIPQNKNFPLAHVRPHFRDYHLMLDDQGEQIFSMTDAVASAAEDRRDNRSSIGKSRLQRIADNDAQYVTARHDR